MQPRTELALALGIVAALGAGAAALGVRRQTAADDPSRSTFVAGPRGARGYAEALERLGVRVERSRQRTRRVGLLTPERGTLLAVLDPDRWLTRDDAAALAAYRRRGGDVLLAGEGARQAMQCYGYSPDALRRGDSVTAPARGPADGARGPMRVSAVLIPWSWGADTTRSAAEQALGAGCAPIRPIGVDTLAAADDRRPVALRLTFDVGGAALLVSDGGLFANRTLRDTPAGEFALGLVVGRYRTVRFDEAAHGFGAGGSLRRALGGWVRSSPWGWVLVQLAAAGVLALLVSGIRFGPPRAAIVRRRRSPLEHVRALATALAAARGHALAVRLLVQGLRRRLAGPGAPPIPRGDPRPWLDAIASELTTPRGRAAAARLRQLTTRPTRDDSVLEAALAVEDVWEELKP
jgi:hypothetical protein